MRKNYDEILGNLEWKVINWNINKRKIEYFNIFWSCRFCDDLKRLLKEKGKTMDEFVEALRRSCMWSFWAKCEYEIQVNTHMPSRCYEAELNENSLTVKKQWYAEDSNDVVYSREDAGEFDANKLKSGRCFIQMADYDTSKKIDVYYQLLPNMRRLAEYIVKETGYRVKKEDAKANE